MIDTIEHNAPLGNSDHETLEFNFRFGIKQKKHYQNKLCWFKGNYEKINAQLILLSSFIQGVSYFLDIDLLSGMFSIYIIFNSSANLCHRLSKI
jgi:hypothetical protein